MLHQPASSVQVDGARKITNINGFQSKVLTTYTLEPWMRNVTVMLQETLKFPTLFLCPSLR